jgi:uncharacterized protein
VGANVRVIEQAYAAFGRCDIPGVLALVDDDVDWISPRSLPQGGEYHGMAGAVKFFETLGAAWSSLEIEVDDMGEVGDSLVLGLVRASGTLTGGAQANFSGVHVFTVRNGKIVRFREYTDLDVPIG